MVLDADHRIVTVVPMSTQWFPASTPLTAWQGVPGLSRPTFLMNVVQHVYRSALTDVLGHADATDLDLAA